MIHRKSNVLWAGCCLHLGAKGHASAKFNRYVQVARRDRWDVVLLGDLCDFGVPVGTKHVEAVWDQTMTPGDQIDACVEALWPIKRQIKAICGGNHAHRIFKTTGILPEKIIAEYLHVPYVSNTHTFRWRGFTFFMAHGMGEADIKKVQLRHEGVDCFLIGHTHNLSWIRVNHLVGVNQKRKDIWLGRAGCFLDDADYGKRALYQPSAIGSLLISAENGVLQARLGI